jgi:xanthine dehydrogenase accessory factor
MSQSVLNLAYQLTQVQEAFVLATVVWCEHPTSAKPGAQAIIQHDGRITGWIGGNCAQPVVVREALRLLKEGGDPYLLHLGGAEDTEPPRRERDIRVFPMSCASGGALEIYMEPHFPPPHLVLIGDSPVIVALSQMAPALDFAVTQIQHADLSQLSIDERTYILIATHGQYDEDALEQALPGPAAYVGMVSSPRRAEACRAYLRTSGLTEQAIERLRAPAGLDIGAVTPAEIAASILAELVQVQRHKSTTEQASHEHASDRASSLTAGTSADATSLMPETAIDPVCGMSVEIARARHHLNYNGQDFYFCCPGCKRQFERNPQEYLFQSL